MILEHKTDDHSDNSDNESIAENNENDEIEDVEETQRFYKESFWPAKPDTPKGFTYKGKSKIMTHAMNKIKSILKKSTQKEINNIKFKIQDTKIHGGATQIIVQMELNAERGIAIAECWGPNKKKECTILVKKSKEYDEKFVSILAKSIIQPLLDYISNGKSVDDILKARKNKTIKCSVCEKNFSSNAYLKVHMTKLHTGITNKCQDCDYIDKSKNELKEHIRTMHGDSQHTQERISDAQTSLNNSKDDTLIELEKNSWEERRMDDQLMDTEIKKEGNVEIMDEGNHGEENKRESEEKGEVIEDSPRIKRVNTEETNPSKKKSSRRRKKRKRNLSEPLPPHLKQVPDNIKHFTNTDDIILKIVPDGACAPRAGAAHIFEDQDEGIRFRSVINTHIADRWSYYSEKISFPYVREIGTSGKNVKFQNSQEYLDFLRTNPDAAFLWSDNEELIAIANLYQIDIDIIKTKGPDDKNPSLNKIKADSKLAEFAILPKGKVQNMTLINTNESHYDLIISKTSRIAQNILTKDEEPIEKPDSTHLKEELDSLKLAYTECLNHIEKLEKELEALKNEKQVKETVDTENDGSNIEELILLKGKSSGFTREGPQFESIQKPINCEKCPDKFKTQDQLNKHLLQHTNTRKNICNICGEMIQTKSDLKDHIRKEHTNNWQLNCSICDKKFNAEDQQSKHTDIASLVCNLCEKKLQTQDKYQKHKMKHSDEDWNCDDCDHQTSSEEKLKKHLATTHHNSRHVPNPANQKFACNLCTSKFYNKSTLEEHKNRVHRSFKPCKNLPNCSYGHECMFNHNKVSKDMLICYECGYETKTLNDLMLHRKSKHVVSDCLKQYTNECKFTSEKCWFIHKTKTNISNPNTQEHVLGNPITDALPTNSKQKETQSSVFQATPANLAPPSPQLTQATWLRMVQMVDSLNKMMVEIREASPFL